jgi:hypothetical protein
MTDPTLPRDAEPGDAVPEAPATPPDAQREGMNRVRIEVGKAVIKHSTKWG